MQMITRISRNERKVWDHISHVYRWIVQEYKNEEKYDFGTSSKTFFLSLFSFFNIPNK